ncbi:DNA-directed DNA polymerase alpha subunit pol12 [Paramarasmius palmivorus]|uniref:DNA polymerase alpha subunit B n=1 Tax=Paramarasmius palmivorus TaxID=297713 RepID=A0AAW0DY97_9AGAR
MAQNGMKEEIARRFGEEVASDSKLVDECISMCQIYNLTPEQLQFKWEAATYSAMPSRAHEAARFTQSSLADVKAQIIRERSQNGVRKGQIRNVAGAATVNRSKMPQFMSRNNRIVMGTSSPQIKTEVTGGTDFSNVAGPSKVVFRGPKMDASSRKKRGYRYMYEKPSERSEVLGDRIDEIGELVREHYGLSELGDPSAATDEDIFVVGRITHDVEAAESSQKLTESTLTLESSRMLSAGARVTLRFDSNLKIRGGARGAGALSLFPGAIVCFKGRNGGGGWFLVNEILALPPTKGSSASPKAEPDASDSSFSMSICSGPYTPHSDLKYKPWQSLQRTLQTSKPSVILLTGPFVESSHPLIEAGDTDETPLGLFHRVFLDPLCLLLDTSPGSIAILVPSVQDIISSHAVFPQREFGLEVTRADPRIHLVPNPAKFSINGVTFASTSVDVLFHLRKEEIVKRGEEVDSVAPVIAEDTGSDSMANLCRNLLQQRSFYPIFPVPPEVSSEVNLDVTHSEGVKMVEDEDNDYAPDVLILPSKFKQFTKHVHSTLVVNPSSATKAVYGTLHLEAGASRALKERLKAEVVKIQGD